MKEHSKVKLMPVRVTAMKWRCIVTLYNELKGVMSQKRRVPETRDSAEKRRGFFLEDYNKALDVYNKSQ